MAELVDDDGHDLGRPLAMTLEQCLSKFDLTEICSCVNMHISLHTSFKKNYFRIEAS